MSAAPLLEVDDLKVHYPIRQGLIRKKQIGVVRAVDGISFDIRSGETMGLVGESGCGKSTVGRAILRLLDSTSGDVRFEGDSLIGLTDAELGPHRRKMQMIFQDPFSSLNPRMSIGQIIAEPIRVHRLREGKGAIRERVAELLALVGLDPRSASRMPHEFSGGQRQRIGIARALAVEPRFLVCDEAVSALDVSVQAQVINLLEDLQAQMGLTYLFIAHGLSIVNHISDRVAVMYLGKIVEMAETRKVFSAPRHPYTQLLLAAAPVPDPDIEASREQVLLTGDLPSPLNPPSGCRFHTRCPLVIERCRVEEPPLEDNGSGHKAACWRAGEPVTAAVTNST